MNLPSFLSSERVRTMGLACIKTYITSSVIFSLSGIGQVTRGFSGEIGVAMLSTLGIPVDYIPLGFPIVVSIIGMLILVPVHFLVVFITFLFLYWPLAFPRSARIAGLAALLIWLVPFVTCLVPWRTFCTSGEPFWIASLMIYSVRTSLKTENHFAGVILGLIPYITISIYYYLNIEKWFIMIPWIPLLDTPPIGLTLLWLAIVEGIRYFVVRPGAYPR